jgi:hypothetical protein
MAQISSNPLSGITREELLEAVPESLQSKNIHLHWIEKNPAGKGEYVLIVKLDVNGQGILLRSRIREMQLISEWDLNHPTYHTNARLVALERVLTDPSNEDKLLSL